jgi:hypothetical protein
MSKIKVNAEVRTLLVELDNAFQKFHAASAKFSEPKSMSVHNLAELNISKSAAEHEIIGVAWRINKASTGVKD